MRILICNFGTLLVKNATATSFLVILSTQKQHWLSSISTINSHLKIAGFGLSNCASIVEIQYRWPLSAINQICWKTNLISKNIWLWWIKSSESTRSSSMLNILRHLQWQEIMCNKYLITSFKNYIRTTKLLHQIMKRETSSSDQNLLDSKRNQKDAVNDFDSEFKIQNILLLRFNLRTFYMTYFGFYDQKIGI